MWPLALRKITNAHVVPLSAGIEELSAALQASARLCWTMRNLSSISPLSPKGPVAELAKKVYFVLEEEEEGEAGGGGGGGGRNGSRKNGKEEEGKRGKRRRNLLAEWQSALAGAAAAAARAVPRSYSPLPLSTAANDEESPPPLDSALAALRTATEALHLARERASSGDTAAAVASLLSRAVGDEKGEIFFAEEARFGMWEGAVGHAVESAERVGRAVEALRGLMPK